MNHPLKPVLEQSMRKIIGTVRTIDVTKEPPTEAEVFAAVSVLNNQRLAIYQELYASGLTMPGNCGTFRIERVSSVIGESVWLNVILNKSISSDEYGFKAKNAGGVVEKARLLLDAVKASKRKCHGKACCPLATIRECVCDVSFSCPIHGSECHGSHD